MLVGLLAGRTRSLHPENGRQHRKKESSQRIPWSLDVAIVALQKPTFHGRLSRAHKICRRSGQDMEEVNLTDKKECKFTNVMSPKITELKYWDHN